MLISYIEPVAQSELPETSIQHLYYFESSDAELMGSTNVSARYAFTTLPGEEVTLIAYGLDELLQPQLRLYNENGAEVQQGIRDPEQPFVSYIRFAATDNTRYEFTVEKLPGSEDGLARVMLFEGEPLRDDLTLLDDINPLLPGRAFMVGGEDPDGLSAVLEVLEVDRFTEKPDVFASRATFSNLPEIEERFNPVDRQDWINIGDEIVYTFNIRAAPERMTVATRNQSINYQRFNLNTFFFFDYYFIIGEGSDPVRVVRDEECAFLIDRSECVESSPTGGRTPEPALPAVPEVPTPEPVGLPVVDSVEDISGVILPPPPDEVDCLTGGFGVNIVMVISGEQGGSFCPDSIIGTPGDDNIAGFGDNDYLEGGAGDDVLRGGAGNDLILPGTGNDIVDGENDIDTVSYIDISEAVTVDLTNTYTPTGGIATYGAYTDILLNIENIIGSNFDDVLIGSSGNNSIAGSDGNDTIQGQAGNDVLYGGNGNDTLRGGNDDDALFGDAGNDDLRGGNGNDTISGGAGDDTILGNAGNNTLSGDAGNDTIRGETGNDIIEGGSGDDAIYPGGGVDSIRGGSGNDTIYLNGTYINTFVTGGDAALDPFSGNDTYLFYDDSQGNLSIYDGVGIDTIDFSAISATPGSRGVVGGTGTGTYTDIIPGLTLYLSNDIDILIASNGDDVISGTANNETINTLDGDDLITGSLGNDTISGGAGNDTLDYSGLRPNDGVLVTLNTGQGQITEAGFGVVGTDTISGIENVIGTGNDDGLVGDGADNILNPGTGGADILDGRGGNDTADFSLRGTGITANLVTGVASDGVDNIFLSNIESIVGTDFADNIEGNNINNTIATGEGDDNIIATAGTDTVDGGNGIDTITYTAGSGGVAPGNITATINYLTGSTVNAGNWSGTDTLINLERIIVDASVTSDDGFNIQAGGTDTTNFVGLNGGMGTDTYDFLTGVTGYVDLANKSVDNINFAVTPTGWNPFATGVWQDVYNNGSLFVRLSAAVNPNCRAPGDANPIFGQAGIADTGANTFDRTLSLCDSNEAFYGNGGARTPDAGIIDEVDYSLLTPGVGQFLNFFIGNNIIVSGTGVNIGTDTIYDVERIIGTSGQDIFNFNDASTLYQTQGSVLMLDGLNGGNDRLNFGAVTLGGITIDLTALNVDQTVFPGMDLQLLSNFTEVIGSNNDDVIIGNANDNVIWDRAGADNISGNAGDDTFIMDDDSDDDTISGGTGTDTANYLIEGTGSTFTLQAGDDTVLNNVSGTGTDTLSSIERIIASNSDDTFNITDFSGYTLLAGSDGNDTFNATVQAGVSGITMQGDTGVDTLKFDTSSVSVAVDFNAGTVTGNGSTFNFTTIENITGSQANDTFALIDDAIASIFDGAGDLDDLNYNGASDLTFTINGAAGTNQIASANPTDTFTNFERIRGGTGNDIFNILDDTDLIVVMGRDGDDSFVMDTLNSNLTINGGNDTDTADYRNVASDLNLNVTATTTITDGVQTQTLNNIENILTGSGNDTVTLTGNPGANINSHTGDDSFNVTAPGNYTLNAGAAADTDSITYAAPGALFLTYTGTGTDTVTDLVNTDTLINFDNFTLGTGNDTFTIMADGIANRFDGTTGNDTATYAGNAAAITFTLNNAGAGTSTAGLDTLVNIENIIGGDNNDSFTVTDATSFNSVDGGDGDDTFAVNQDTVALDYTGGNGNDTLTYTTNLAQLVTLNNGNGTVQTGAITDNVFTMENITTGTGNDIFNTTWDIVSNTFDGNLGTDNLIYQADSTVISTLNFTITGTGEGTLSDGTTTDTFQNMEILTASDIPSGDDSFFVLDAAGAANLDGGATGTDTVLFGEAVNVTLTNGNGSAGTIILTDIENLNTGAGDDTITQNADLDTDNNAFNGGDGNDTVIYDSTAPTDITVTMNGTDGTVNHGANTDTLTNVENVTTGDGADTFNITDDTGLQTLDGRNGDDNFMVNTNNENTSITGGTGTDSVTYNTTDDLSVSVNGGTETVSNGTGTDTLDSIENITTDSGNDTFLIDISSITANFTLDARGGNNTFQFIGNSDAVAGVTVNIDTDDGTGDTLDFSGVTGSNGVTLDMSDTTNDQEVFGGGTGFFIRLNNTINNLFGTEQDDSITGTTGDDNINTNGGNDTVNAGAGDDAVNGGDDDDNISGDAGNDTLNGDAGNDTVTGGSTDTTNVNNNYGESGSDTIEGGAGDDTLIGGNNIDCTAPATVDGTDTGTDEIYGGDGNDTIEGDNVIGATCTDNTTGGDDELYGGNNNTDGSGDDDTGDDIVNGGEGDDQVYGGNNNGATGTGDDTGNDTVDGGEGNDAVYGGNNNENNAVDNAGNDTGNDSVNGGAGNDQVYGGNNNTGTTGNNAGNDGNDTVVNGGADNDTVYGGNNNANGAAGNNAGNDGDDAAVDGGAGNDEVYGGNNNENGAEGANNGNDGADNITDLNGVDQVYGGNNNTDNDGTPDTTGDDGDDTIVTNDGDNADTVVTGNNNNGGAGAAEDAAAPPEAAPNADPGDTVTQGNA